MRSQGPISTAHLPIAAGPRSLAYGALVVVLLLAHGGCAARRGPDGRVLTEDQRITAEVQRILEENEAIDHGDLEVETRDGVVVLSGFQESLEPVAEALQRIARVRGVLEVVNRVRLIRMARRTHRTFTTA